MHLHPNDLTKVNPIIAKEDSQQEDEADKVISIVKSNSDEFNIEENKNDNDDEIDWDNESDHNLSNNHEEFKSFPNNTKSNNVEK